MDALTHRFPAIGRRLAALTVAAAIGAAVVPGPVTAAEPAASDMVYAFASSEGGSPGIYRENAPLTVTLTQDAEPHLAIQAGSDLDLKSYTGFNLRLYAPVGTDIAPGTYADAQAEVGWPTGGSPDHPRIGSDQFPCLQEEPGWFRIDELEVSGPDVMKLAATVVCDGVEPNVRPHSMEIRFHSTLPVAPVHTATRELRLPRTLAGTTSDPMSVTLTANGGTPLHPAAAVLGGAAADDFQVADDGCAGAALGAGATCTVDVLFAPVDGDSLTRHGWIDIPDDSITGYSRTWFTGTVTRPTTITITTSANPATLPAAAQLIPQVVPAPSGGSIEWIVDGVLEPSTTSVGFPFTLGNRSGTHTVVARYTGWEGYQRSGPSNEIAQITYIGSTLELTAGPAWSGLTGAVDLGAKVKQATSNGKSGGTVTFTDETTGAVLGLAEVPSGFASYEPQWAALRDVVLEGMHRIRADYTSPDAPLIADATATFTVEGLSSYDPTAATHLFIGGMASLSRAGRAGSITVTALDAHGRIDAGYRGTVKLTSNDDAATLPGAYSFTASDAGVHRFTATLRTGGARSVTASDEADRHIAGTASTTVDGHGATFTPEQVSVGDGTTCAVVDDGTVRCWGRNKYGQVGDGTKVERRSPVKVAGIANASAVSVGFDHACALLADHTVRCWGANTAGQLGDGTQTARTGAVAVTGVTTATAISAGGSATCALLADASVVCWGWGLHQGATIAEPTPIAMPGLAPAIAVSVGGSVCSILTDHTVRCWGSNSVGELGDGTQTKPDAPVQALGVTGATAVVVASSHACAVVAFGNVKCWGYNEAHQLGTDAPGVNPTPTTVPGVTGATAITASNSTTCALIGDGTTRCWGDNAHGEYADGTTTSHVAPIVGGVANAAGLRLGGQGSGCAITTGGVLRCWGDNTYGQVGDGRVDQLAPVQARTMPTAGSLAAMSGATCARLVNGTIDCWGDAKAGQTGNGEGTFTMVPTPVPGVTDVVQLSGATDFACARISDGTLRCWGNYTDWQLGDPEKNGSTGAPGTSGPVTVAGITTAVDVSAAGAQACAVLQDGTAWCWGRLGLWSNTRVGTPTKVEGITDAIQVEAGADFACALLVSGHVTCWGNNSHYQLGTDQVYSSAAPLVVPAVSDVTSIAGLSAGMCALRSDRTVVCWGTVTSGFPAGVVSGVTDAASIAGGAAHACAVTLAGSVVCWGANEHGQLGDGTRTASLTSIIVPGVTATAVAAGAYHTCAVSTGGTVLCWGGDASGQVGIARHPFAPFPVNVALESQPGLRITLDVPPATGTFRVPLAFGVLPGSPTPTGWFASLSPSLPVSGPKWAAAPPASITLPPGDGTRTVYAWVQDALGDVSPAASATVIADSTPPIAGLTLPDTTRTRTVTVTATGTDGESAIDAWLLSTTAANPPANDPRWSWTRPTSYTISSGDGVKTLNLWVRDRAGNVSRAASASVRLDTVAPSGGGAPKARTGSGSAASSVPVAVSWAAATDMSSGLVTYQLAYRLTRSSTWKTAGLSSPGTASATINLAPGTYRLRVRAVDRAGNVGAWHASGSVEVHRTQETGSVVRVSGFTRVAMSGASGGAVVKATAAGSKATFKVTGRSVAWVGSIGPGYGMATVWVDGSKVATVNLYAATGTTAKVLWRRTISAGSRHTVKIVVTGTKDPAASGTRVDVDAFTWTR